MDSPKESNFTFKPPSFESSEFVPCATSMFPGANSVKSNCENISDFSDSEDKYDAENLALFAKNFKRSFNKKTNLSLATKLHHSEKQRIDALHELDVLKDKHMTLENNMHNLVETNKLLELKVANLQVELDKTNATLKKLNAGSQILEEVLASQKVASNKEGFGSIEIDSSSKARGKFILIKPSSSAPLVDNKAKSPMKETSSKDARTKPNPPTEKKQCAAVKNTTTKRGEATQKKERQMIKNRESAARLESRDSRSCSEENFPRTN